MNNKIKTPRTDAEFRGLMYRIKSNLPAGWTAEAAAIWMKNHSCDLEMELIAEQAKCARLRKCLMSIALDCRPCGTHEYGMSAAGVCDIAKRANAAIGEAAK